MNTGLYSSDQAIWDAFQQGDREAYALLYQQYADTLYKYGRRITTDVPLVEDCIQDLFIDLWRTHASLSRPDSIRFYLYKVLRRKLMKAMAKVNYVLDERVLLDEARMELVLPREMELIAEQSTQELLDKLRHEFNNLTPRQKEALILRFYDNLSYNEIAELLSISYQSVNNLIHRSIIALRVAFSVKLILVFITRFTA